MWHGPNTVRNYTATEDIVKSYSTQAKVSRNARLAMLKFYSQECAASADNQDRLFEACENHFRAYLTKYVCFRDLEPHVACLDSSRKERFLITTSACAKSLSPKGDASEVWASPLPVALLLINVKGGSCVMDYLRNQCIKDGLLSCHLP